MKRLWRVVQGLLMLTGLLVAAVLLTPLVPWWARQLAGPWNDPTGDVLIVLGGSAEEGIIGVSSYWRSVYAVQAYRRAPFARVVVSGGGPEHTAALMRDFLVGQGIPADRIMVEDRATSTHENAVYVKQLLQGLSGRKVLLTSDYHMYRAYRAFTKSGMMVAPRPFPDAIKRSSSRSERWPLFFDLCGEAGKSAYYFIRGWI